MILRNSLRREQLTAIRTRVATGTAQRTLARLPPGTSLLLGNSAEGGVDVQSSSGPGGLAAGRARVLPAHALFFVAHKGFFQWSLRPL